MPSIELDLRNHCIETEIKRLYDKLMAEYFKTTGEDKTLEDKLALLQTCLDLFDFHFLRGFYPQLAGGKECHVVLKMVETQLPEILLDGCPVN